MTTPAIPAEINPGSAAEEPIPLTDDPAVQQTLNNMAAAGLPTTTEVYEDYFGVDIEHKFYLPDGKQYIVHKVLAEGDRKKYQNQTNRDVVVERVTGNARMRLAPGDERHFLLSNAVTDWHMMRKQTTGEWLPIPWSTRAWEEFLDKANPAIIDELEKAVRKANPWLNSEMTVEAIDKEIENLKDLRDEAVKREQGK